MERDPIEFLARAQDPRQWPADFATDEAEQLFIASSVMSVLTMADPELLFPFHEAFFSRAPRDVRMTALSEILGTAEEIKEAPVGMAMAPFLQLETDRQILSSAALYFCGLAIPSPSGDVTEGARMLLDMITFRLADGDPVAAGTMAAGLMLMGDARFLGAMEKAWAVLDHEGREVMTQGNSGMATDAHVRFLIGRLKESQDASEYGCLAAALGRLSAVAAERGVVEIERLVPVSEDPANPIRPLASWSRPEYIALIQPELEELAASERGPERVMPMVMQMWGL